MEIIMDCVSPHVARLQQGHTRLVWLEPRESKKHARVIAWTCSCRAMVYELCHSGGMAFVRRTLQLDEAPQVHETHRWALSEAGAMWAALLTGNVR